MVIALFGISGVGKTTVGKLVSEALGYEFYDLDDELKLHYSDTISNIQDSCFNRHEFDSKKGIVLKHILSKCSNNSVIAVSPIYYTMSYKTIFKKSNVFSIVLEDAAENIAKRMIMTDDEDNIIEDYIGDFEEDLKDVKYFISRYKNAHSRIEHKYYIEGKNAEETAKEIVKLIRKSAYIF